MRVRPMVAVAVLAVLLTGCGKETPPTQVPAPAPSPKPPRVIVNRSFPDGGTSGDRCRFPTSFGSLPTEGKPQGKRTQLPAIS